MCGRDRGCGLGPADRLNDLNRLCAPSSGNLRPVREAAPADFVVVPIVGAEFPRSTAASAVSVLSLPQSCLPSFATGCSRGIRCGTHDQWYSARNGKKCDFDLSARPTHCARGKRSFPHPGSLAISRVSRCLRVGRASTTYSHWPIKRGIDGATLSHDPAPQRRIDQGHITSNTTASPITSANPRETRCT